MYLLILADDLTGAADCGVGFAARGHPANVILDCGYGCVSGFRESQGVLAIDTNNRDLAAESSAVVTRTCWQALGRGSTPLYKKIDSMLRGNWAAEVRALSRHAGLATVAPAFPETGRTTFDGRQCVHGEPLGTKASGAAGREGTAADIPEQLTAQGLRTALLSLQAVRQPPPSITAQLTEHAGHGVEAIVCDANRASDLAAIAEASLGPDESKFWVGSAGLAREIARLDVRRSQSMVENYEHRALAYVLALVGSPALPSQTQADVLAAETGIPEVVVPPELLLCGTEHGDWSVWQDRIKTALAGGDLLLRIGMTSRSLSRTADGVAMSRALARLIGSHAALADGLLATGGATTRVKLDGLGVTALRLHREIEPGVVLSESADECPLLVVTKAGAFGNEQTLLHAYRQLKLGVIG